MCEVPSPVARESGDLHTRWVRPIARILIAVRSGCVFTFADICLPRTGWRAETDPRPCDSHRHAFARSGGSRGHDRRLRTGGRRRHRRAIAVGPARGGVTARRAVRRSTAPLSPYASEAALSCARTRVEVEYLIELAALDATPIALDEEAEAAFRAVYEEFSAEDARLIKALEVEGPRVCRDQPRREGGRVLPAGSIGRVGRFRNDCRQRGPLYPWIHFGLTSEDVNNLAQRLLVKQAVSEAIVPAIREVRDALVDLAQEHRGTPMLAHTHGQPATPTTFGKEMAVYASRLGRALGRVVVANGDLSGKLAGASGTYAAHDAAYPDVDWRAFAESFVRGLDLEHTPLATQVNPATTSRRCSTRCGASTTSSSIWTWTRGCTSPTATSASGPSSGGETAPRRCRTR